MGLPHGSAIYHIGMTLSWSHHPSMWPCSTCITIQLIIRHCFLAKSLMSLFQPVSQVLSISLPHTTLHLGNSVVYIPSYDLSITGAKAISSAALVSWKSLPILILHHPAKRLFPTGPGWLGMDYLWALCILDALCPWVFMSTLVSFACISSAFASAASHLCYPFFVTHLVLYVIQVTGERI